MFDKYLILWGLVPGGEPIKTHSSHLLPVFYRGIPAMLKVAAAQEEIAGSVLMDYWNGDGAARVYCRHDSALLLERAIGGQSLTDISRDDDDRACDILCSVAASLHKQRPNQLPNLVHLSAWFEELRPAALKQGGILIDSLRAADWLLASPQDQVPLHGDIHHGNVLDFGQRGWLAIDPKGLFGERGFDYANIFGNPDLNSAPVLLPQRLSTIAKTAGLDRRRLLTWVLAQSGLSAAWGINEPDSKTDIFAEGRLSLARAAANELERARP
jgi:streptomycin 6-kinase